MNKTQYAILLNINHEAIQTSLTLNPNLNILSKINMSLNSFGFHQKDGLYLGNFNTDPVHAVLAVQQLSKSIPNAKSYINIIQLIRIEEITDLSIAL